jgi:hypothetical protein
MEKLNDQPWSERFNMPNERPLGSRLASARVGWPELAGVPATIISAYERDRRQPTLPTLLRLLRAAGFDLSMQLVPLDDHDDVLATV